MRLKLGVSSLLLVALAACSGGGGANSTLPTNALTTSSKLTAGSATMTYTAPLGGLGGNNAVYLLAANGCGDIPVYAASSGVFADVVSGKLERGTLVSVTGTATNGTGATITAGCPTGGIVAVSVVAAGTVPSPLPSALPSTTPLPHTSPSAFPSPSPLPTVSAAPGSTSYSAPFGGVGGRSAGTTTIYVLPANGCGDIGATLPSGANVPAAVLNGSLPRGTAITIRGLASLASGATVTSGCPTGGIVATSVVVGSEPVPSPVPSTAPSVAPSATPSPVPTVAPTTPPGGCPAVSALTNDADPPACWTPYAPTSVWNQKLPTSITYAANSNSAINYYFSNYGGTMGPTGISAPFQPARDWGMPYYFGRATDPLVTIHCNGYGGTACNAQIHIPANAASERGGCCSGDQHMTVVDLTNNNEYDFYQWTTAPPYHSGQTISVNAGNMGNVVSGDGFWNCSGANAGCTGLLGGVVFVSELQAHHVNHKLAVAFPCTNSSQGVFPVHGGSYQSCTAPGSNGNTAPIGSIVYWDETPDQVAARSVSDSAKTLLNAMHEYGAIVTDTNGNNGSFSVTDAPESQTRYVSMGNSDIVGAYAASNFEQSWGGSYHIDLDRLTVAEIKTHLHILPVCAAQSGC